jgi:hypothetical protein
VSVLFGQVYLPTYSNGLKENASFVGAQWRSSDVSGLQTIVWRCQWERTHVGSLKDQLIAYNQDDCAALTLLTEELLKLRLESKTRTNVDFADTPKQHATERGTEIHRNFEELLRSAHMRYSQKSIRFRKREGDTGADTPKRNTSPVFKKHKLSTRKARLVPVPRKRKCPRHPAQDLMPSERTANHTLLDLEFNKNGCRKVVVRYCGKRSYCPLCHRGHLPPAVKRLHNQVYGRGFQAWAVYQRVVLRLPYALIAKGVQDILHENISVSIIDSFVQRCSEQFAYTETLLLRNILQGLVIHVDETKISIRGVQQFVWVITDGCRVTFRLTETRETDFLRQLLAGYSGTLVSDFYAGYDALPFRQQKCLVHLVRDLNDDLWKNPFNDEYEQFVSSVRDVLVPILEDIRRFGLKVLHLRKHQKQVDRFYRDTICGRSGSHEITVKYQKRFERYRNSIFSFLGSDGIPWNNNAAERALRHLAVQRKISGVFSSKGANHYLRLLAIAQTCRFQNKSFLGFLLSGCVDVDEYSEGRRRQANLCPWV